MHRGEAERTRLKDSTSAESRTLRKLNLCHRQHLPAVAECPPWWSSRSGAPRGASESCSPCRALTALFWLYAALAGYAWPRLLLSLQILWMKRRQRLASVFQTLKGSWILGVDEQCRPSRWRKRNTRAVRSCGWPVLRQTASMLLNMWRRRQAALAGSPPPIHADRRHSFLQEATCSANEGWLDCCDGGQQELPSASLSSAKRSSKRKWNI